MNDWPERLGHLVADNARRQAEQAEDRAVRRRRRDHGLEQRHAAKLARLDPGPAVDPADAYRQAHNRFLDEHPEPQLTDEPCTTCKAPAGQPCTWRRRPPVGHPCHAPRENERYHAQRRRLDAAHAHGRLAEAQAARHTLRRDP